MIDMLDAGIHHLPDRRRRTAPPVGVVTATDLMYLESRTPFALRRSIAHAATVDEVVEAASHLPQVVVSLIARRRRRHRHRPRARAAVRHGDHRA